MKDRSYLQRRMPEETAQPVQDLETAQDYASITCTDDMAALLSSFVCSPQSESEVGGCGMASRTAMEANTELDHEVYRPSSISIDNDNNNNNNTCLDKFDNDQQRSSSRHRLHPKYSTTRLKSALCTLSSSSPSITSFPHTKPSAIAILLCLVMTFLVSPSIAFNIDLESAIIHEGKNGSMFGYSVAQHVDQSTHWLLIGAPKAQTRQRGVEKGGAVYRCKTDRVNSCQQVPFDTKGNNVEYVPSTDRHIPIEEKSNQWFGATVKSSGESGVIVACAPRYIYFGSDRNKREPVGMCWVAKTSTTDYESYSPCSKAVDRVISTDQYHRHGFCHFGFSATFTNDGRRLMIAAPGSWYWQGQLYNFKTDERGRVFAKTPEGNATEDNTYRGQMFVYDAITGTPRYTNDEGSADTDYGYRGYSSAIGKFDGDKEDDYVVGIPKGDDYVGMIEIYTQNLTLLGSISGEQIGSYFGGAVTVVDLNGDSLDDIIVGAPLFTNFKHSKTWDTGRVYIYYQTSSHAFKANNGDILDGVATQSRFGMALSGLGDIDFNGYDDLCVGAPYDGEDNRGAIYIFHGSKDGIITEVSQIIYASDFKSPLSAFGSSISAGTDQDGNYYPDVIVGAHDSDKAVFLRARPIVKVTANLKLYPESVDLDKVNCTLFDGTEVICLTVYTCFGYDGVGLPSDLYFDLEWHLDAKESNTSNTERRAFFLESHQSVRKKTVKIKKAHVEDCQRHKAYVRPDAIDRLSSIRTILKFKLNFEEEEKNTRRKRDLQPILNSYTRTYTSFTVEIKKNCGEDKVCHPNLFVSFILVDIKHVFGDSKDLEIKIIVGNNGEDAFNSKLFVQMPPHVDYSGISVQKSNFPISCDPLQDGSQVVVCTLGNPTPYGALSEFTFKVKPTNSNNTDAILKFGLHVNSSNPEMANFYEDNQANFAIPLTVEADIKLLGTANPEQFNATEQGDEDGIGKLVRHVIEMKSLGLSPISETELLIRWPNRDSGGRPVLTLDGPMKTEGNGKCSVVIITPGNASIVKDNTLDKYPVFNMVSKDKQTRNIRCVYRYCTFIRCTLGYMDQDSKFILTIYSRLKVKRFLEDRREIDEVDVDTYNLISSAVAKVVAVPFNFTHNVGFPTESLELVTTLSLVDDGGAGSQKLAIWIYVVAISVGILLLLLIILLLWCCGFFKRKKHEDDNGYFAVNEKNDIDNKYVD